MKLTKTAIAGLTKPGIYWDKEVSGLGVRVGASGSKSWLFKYRIGRGRDAATRKPTLGSCDDLTPDQARAMAREWKVQARDGDDPLEATKRRSGELTVAQLAEDWLEAHATGLKSEQAIRGYVNNDIVPAIGRTKVTDVRRAEVIDLIEKKAAKAPRSAAQLLIYTRLLFEYATDKEIIPINPLAGLKPSKIKVKGKRAPLKQVQRQRILSADEVKQFWTMAEKVDTTRLSALALKLILLTGQRPGEIAGMREGEINGRWWTIPAARRGKTEQPNTVYLTDTALDIIAAARDELARLRRRRTASPGDFVFETRPGSALTTAALDRAVRRNLDRLGNVDDEQWGHWRPHDLRRTMRTGLSACRVRPDIAELTIGHGKKGIVAVYDQHAFEDERRAALVAWEGRLLAIAEGRDPDADRQDNVVQLDAAR